LRGNLVSLDPFFVAVSVSINDQQFFPQVSSHLMEVAFFDRSSFFT